MAWPEALENSGRFRVPCNGFCANLYAEQFSGQGPDRSKEEEILI